MKTIHKIISVMALLVCFAVSNGKGSFVTGDDFSPATSSSLSNPLPLFDSEDIGRSSAGFQFSSLSSLTDSELSLVPVSELPSNVLLALGLFFVVYKSSHYQRKR